MERSWRGVAVTFPIISGSVRFVSKHCRTAEDPSFVTKMASLQPRRGGKACKAVGLFVGGLRGGFAMPPQHGLDAGDQLARIDRLAEIVVGADLEPDDAVDVLFQRGEENDGNVGALRRSSPEPSGSITSSTMRST